MKIKENIKKTCGCRFLCQKSDINIVIVSYAVMQREHEVWDIWLKDYSKLYDIWFCSMVKYYSKLMLSNLHHIYKMHWAS